MSHEAEQSVLGGLLLDATAWDRIADIVKAEDFTRREHWLIFNAIAALASESTVADVITTSELLKRKGELEAAGGLAYLGSLANNTPSAANIVSYAGIVRDKALERRLVATASQVAEIAKGEDPINTKLDQAQALIMSLAEQGNTTGPMTAGAILPAVVDEMERRFKAGGRIIGLPTGFTDLDEMTSGLQPSDLIVIAGRPSMGKTTIATNIAELIAQEASEAVLVFSLEMSREQLVMRMIASLGRLNFQSVRTGRLDQDEWSKVAEAVARLNAMKLLIDDTPALSVTEVRTRARRAKREHGLALVVVDYLQLMRGEGENRNHEVAQISAGLKALAKELHVPVIALSQLNRGVESRENKRPRMADLRDSGSVEQDADLILLLYRDEAYNESSAYKGIAEVIVSKQRNGPTGTVRLAFNDSSVRFDNFTGKYAPESISRSRRWSGGFDG